MNAQPNRLHFSPFFLLLVGYPITQCPHTQWWSTVWENPIPVCTPRSEQQASSASLGLLLACCRPIRSCSLLACFWFHRWRSLGLAILLWIGCYGERNPVGIWFDHNLLALSPFCDLEYSILHAHIVLCWCKCRCEDGCRRLWVSLSPAIADKGLMIAVACRAPACMSRISINRDTAVCLATRTTCKHVPPKD